MIEFIVDGKPVPKARARVVMRGKFPTAYTPKTSKDYENLVAISAKSVMNKFGIRIIETPCKLFVTFYMPVPESTSKKNHALMLSGDIKHSKKPDLDNMLKGLCDGMNGVVWKDDSQVVQITASKHYGEPRAVVIVVPIS